MNAEQYGFNAVLVVFIDRVCGPESVVRAKAGRKSILTAWWKNSLSLLVLARLQSPPQTAAAWRDGEMGGW